MLLPELFLGDPGIAVLVGGYEKNVVIEPDDVPGSDDGVLDVCKIPDVEYGVVEIGGDGIRAGIIKRVGRALLPVYNAVAERPVLDGIRMGNRHQGPAGLDLPVQIVLGAEIVKVFATGE